MFDFPLPVPRNTRYLAMGVDPEATTEEIREATEEFTIELKRQKDAVDNQIETVYRSVEGLKDAYQAVKALHAQGEDADQEKLREAQKRVAELERKAEAVNSHFKHLRERSAGLELKVNEVNRLALHSPEARLAYDKANPPLELLKLAKCTRDEFTDSRVALTLLRRELSAFLTARREEVFQPSDLTREDFSTDFTFNLLLDG